MKKTDLEKLKKLTKDELIETVKKLSGKNDKLQKEIEDLHSKYDSLSSDYQENKAIFKKQVDFFKKWSFSKLIPANKDSYSKDEIKKIFSVHNDCKLTDIVTSGNQYKINNSVFVVYSYDEAVSKIVEDFSKSGAKSTLGMYDKSELEDYFAQIDERKLKRIIKNISDKALEKQNQDNADFYLKLQSNKQKSDKRKIKDFIEQILFGEDSFYSPSYEFTSMFIDEKDYERFVISFVQKHGIEFFNDCFEQLGNYPIYQYSEAKASIKEKQNQIKEMQAEAKKDYDEVCKSECK
ncbi:MAG: hypothetical protein MJ174_00385 [Treponema sp.]|nr:hypothetical protein [Treponema sp.]